LQQDTMFKLLLVVSLAAATAFKADSTLPMTKKPAPVARKLPVELALRLRGGADATEIAKYAIYFASTFMFLPAGRDVVAPGKAVMPDDDKLLAAMFDDKSKPGFTFMWNQWGFNWIALSVAKMMAVSSDNADMIKFGLGVDICTLALMLKGWLPEFKPFFALFGLEALAFAKLVMG